MPRVYRHKLLLDEGLPYKRKFPRLNSRHNVIHIKEDLKKSKIRDEEVHNIAKKLKRVLVVFNIRDYKELASKSKDSGVIGVSQGLPTEQIDKKITALLSKKKPRSLYGKFTSITGET